MSKRACLLLTIVAAACAAAPVPPPAESGPTEPWMTDDPSTWPRITLINQIEYTDADHPTAACGFLIDTGDEVVAATAKHVLIYFKSKTMDSVSFGGALKEWRMFPKDSPDDLVVIDRLINEDPVEPLERIPSTRDWLLFTVRERSDRIQPLRLRTAPVVSGETVYVIGWRYPDQGRQHVHEGRFVRVDQGSLLVLIEALTDNTVPGLSGSPVIDSHGHVIGLMSTKSGDLQRLAPADHARSVLDGHRKTD